MLNRRRISLWFHESILVVMSWFWTACLDKKGQKKGFMNSTNLSGDLGEANSSMYKNVQHVHLEHLTWIIVEFLKSNKIHEEHLAGAIPRLEYKREKYGKIKVDVSIHQKQARKLSEWSDYKKERVTLIMSS